MQNFENIITILKPHMRIKAGHMTTECKEKKSKEGKIKELFLGTPAVEKSIRIKRQGYHTKDLFPFRRYG